MTEIAFQTPRSQSSIIKLPTYEESFFDTDECDISLISNSDNIVSNAKAFDTIPQPPKYFKEQAENACYNIFSLINVNVREGQMPSYVSDQPTGLDDPDNYNPVSARVIRDVYSSDIYSTFTPQRFRRPNLDEYAPEPCVPPVRPGEKPPSYIKDCPPDAKPSQPLERPPFYEHKISREVNEIEYTKPFTRKNAMKARGRITRL